MGTTTSPPTRRAASRPTRTAAGDITQPDTRSVEHGERETGKTAAEPTITGDTRTTWQRLRYFLSVAETGNFAASGGILGRSQAAVSGEVKKLEDELGIELFKTLPPDASGRRARAFETVTVEKDGTSWSVRRVPLTNDGRDLQARCQPWIKHWHDLEQYFLERKDGHPRGPLRVAAGETITLYYLPQVVEGFREDKTFAKVNLVLRRQSLQETLHSLRTGEIDVGIRGLAGQELPRGLTFETLFETPRSVLMPKGHALASKSAIDWDHLRDQSFIVPWPHSSSRRRLESAMAEKGWSLRIAMEAPGWESIKQYVALGVGIAIVPELSVTTDDRRRLAVCPAPDLFGHDRYGILRRDGAQPAAIREFVKLLKSTPWHAAPPASWRRSTSMRRG